MSSKTLVVDIKNVPNKDQWEYLLNNLSTSNTYMKWSWGSYKIMNGWDVKRLQIIDSKSKQLLACCQIQSKRKFFIKIYLIQGGIHLSKVNNITSVYEAIHEALYSYIKNSNKLMWLFLINYQTHKDDAADTSLMKSRFSPILSKNMFTYLVFNKNKELDLLHLSSNWRHNLKRANNNKDLKIEWITSYKDRVEVLSNLSKMYEYMIHRKKFKSGVDLSSVYDELAEDKSIIIAQAIFKYEVVAIRVSSVCNDHLLDLIAASNYGATKCYANYLLMWTMIMKMNELNKKFFDTGGIDPANNYGVYNFKKGLNGRLAINGPIWCIGSNSLLEWATRMLIS